MDRETVTRSDKRTPENPLDRSSEEIRQNIFSKMESLSETIDQLGGRMKETFDWREQVIRHPYIVLGSATGIGFLLSGIFKPSPTPGERIMDAVSKTVEDISDGLSSFQKEASRTAASEILITTVSSIIIKAGIDFLLRKVNDRSARDTPTNGRPQYNAPSEQPQDYPMP